MQKPLEGIKVVELGVVLAAPYCGLLLSDLGAEVIKVESPEGDETRRYLPFVGDTEFSAFTAAINRFRVVVEDFQTTTHTAEALHRLVEAYLSLGLTDEARTAGAILGYNFRGTEWYEDSYKLLTGRGLTLEAVGDNWLRQVYRQMIQGRWL